jgi:hypothetical protein
MVYWDGSSPSAQPFYLHAYRLQLSLSGIAALEAEVLALMQLCYHDHTPLGVVYFGYEGITMTDDDVDSVGWRFLVGPEIRHIDA